VRTIVDDWIFLPVKCDGCKKIFCGDHYSYTGHNCPVAYKKNVQVPVCPLCSAPVPGNLNELPDIRVSRHIDNDCKSDTAVNRRQKVYTNRCTLKGCKQKEMIPVICDKCNFNFCLKHRHPQDHSCTGPQKGRPGGGGNAGNAALARYQQSGGSGGGGGGKNSGQTSRTSNSHPSTRTPMNMSDDAAFQYAIQASLGNPVVSASSGQHSQQEHEDFLLAKAIAESEREAGLVGGSGNAGRGRRNQQSNCDIS